MCKLRSSSYNCSCRWPLAVYRKIAVRVRRCGAPHQNHPTHWPSPAFPCARAIAWVTSAARAAVAPGTAAAVGGAAGAGTAAGRAAAAASGAAAAAGGAAAAAGGAAAARATSCTSQTFSPVARLR